MARSTSFGVVLRVLVVVLTAAGALLAFAMQQTNRAVNQFAGTDTWAYWQVDPVSPYVDRLSGDGFGVFLFSPAAAQVMSVLGWFPWEPVRDLYAVAQVAVLAFLAGPFTGLTILARPVQWELVLGNISLLLALVSVAGVRYPALWSIGILTKITPGIGLVWYASRREWDKLRFALLVTFAVASVSFMLAPSAWFQWGYTLVANQAVAPTPDLPFPVPPFPVRAVVCAAAVWFAAKRDARWVLPLAVAFSSAHLWSYSLSIAVGSLWYVWTPLLRRGEYLRANVRVRPVHELAAVDRQHPSSA